jgi:hypothetical protein
MPSITDNTTTWKRLFLFCLGLFIASAFAMKWMEADLLINGKRISIFGLELFYPKEKITEIFTGMDDKARTILGYHQSFDFVFMTGVFPGIASLCMMAAAKLKSKWLRWILILLAVLQAAAWAFDIIENIYLLKWLKHPVIGDEFGFYHTVVYSKWIIALSGAIISILLLLLSWWTKKIRNPLPTKNRD